MSDEEKPQTTIEVTGKSEKHQVYSLMIGRWQPLHAGHIKLIQKVLDEGRNVLIAIRDTEKSEENPYTTAQRSLMFYEKFRKEHRESRLKMIIIPDIEEVVYGRKVGWGIREIRLDEETEAISGTKIREEKSNG